jgi:WW domain-containing oxidoreductase
MHGAHVVIAARKMESGLALKETILTESPKATVDVMHIDLASLISVKSFAEEYKAKNLGLDILM